mmetsp:Transcript_19099/g.32898  ORF Transcript_19099/g.32898 Transcript_19099/m.32898 type:complete len:427 (+) Transcript_19099:139-1419(+)
MTDKPEPTKSRQEVLDDALFNMTGTGNIEAVRELVKKGGNPAKQINGRHNCLRLAIQRAYFHLVRYFVEECGLKLSDDPKVFHYAALGNIKHPSMLAYLQENGGDVNGEDEKLGTPLTLGLFTSDTGAVDETFVRWLLQHGAEPAHQLTGGERTTALHKAIEAGSYDLVQTLLRCEGVPALLDAKDINGRTPLHVAAEAGRADVVELLLTDFKANPNQMVHYTPLFLAVQNGHSDVAKLLVDAGADVDIKDDTHECSPLHLAASNNLLTIIDLLCKNQATVDVPDKRGFTPLLMAATENYFEAVKLLVKHGANPSFRGPGGATALHVIAGRNQARMAALLLQLGADPDAKDEDGVSPATGVEGNQRLMNVFANYKQVFEEGKTCSFCFTLIDGQKRCARCKSAYYCSVEHQKEDWKEHKLNCKPKK